MAVSAEITQQTVNYSLVIQQDELRNYSFIIKNNTLEIVSIVDDTNLNVELTNTIIEEVTNAKNYSLIIEQFDYQTNTVVQDPLSYTVNLSLYGPQTQQTPSSGVQKSYETNAPINGYQTITLDENVSSVMLFINGLIQSASAFTINNNNIVLPSDLHVLKGDLISIYY